MTSTAGDAMNNNILTSTGSISFENGLSGNTFIYDADSAFGISNDADGGTISASNNLSITTDNTFSPSSGSGNQIDNAFTE